MKIFGIGLTGYIGTVVAEKLQAQGHVLTGLARSEESAALLRSRGIEPVMGKLGDVKTIHEAAKRADAAVGLATGGFLTTALAEGVATNYIGTTSAILDAFEGTGKPYIQVNGTGFWIGNTKESPGIVISEDIEPHPPYFYAGNLPVFRMMRGAAQRQVRSVLVAPAQVYGREGGYIGPVARRFACARKHGAVYMLPPPACGAVTYVHVDDYADLLVLALASGEAGELFFAASDTVPSFDVARAVSRVCGLRGRVEVLGEARLAELEGPIGVNDCKSTLIASGEKARRVLGWQPRQAGLLEELSSLEGKVDIHKVYPGPTREAMARSIKI